MKPLRRHLEKLCGFTLIEITIALGLVAFSLTAIVGLLSVSMQSSRAGMDDTLVAEMTDDLLNTLRRQDFATAFPVSNIYFDINGKRINELDASGFIKAMTVGAATGDNAIYDCAVSVVPDAGTLGENGTPAGVVNLWKVSLTFRWPAGSPNPTTEKTIHADVARY